MGTRKSLHYYRNSLLRSNCLQRKKEKTMTITPQITFDEDLLLTQVQ